MGIKRIRLDQCMLCFHNWCNKLHSCFVTDTPPTSLETTEQFLWAQRASGVSGWRVAQLTGRTARTQERSCFGINSITESYFSYFTLLLYSVMNTTTSRSQSCFNKYLQPKSTKNKTKGLMLMFQILIKVSLTNE